MQDKKPTVEIIDKSTLDISPEKNKSITVIDHLGRTIELRKPSVLDQYRIVEILGGELSANQVYMGMIIPLLFVYSIDGSTVFFSKKTELEGLIKRLDEEGINLVVKSVSENFNMTSGPEEKEKIKK